MSELAINAIAVAVSAPLLLTAIALAVGALFDGLARLTRGK